MNEDNKEIYLALFEQLNEVLITLRLNTKEARYFWFKRELGRSFKSLEEVSIDDLIRVYDSACVVLENRERCYWGKYSLSTLMVK